MYARFLISPSNTAVVLPVAVKVEILVMVTADVFATVTTRSGATEVPPRKAKTIRRRTTSPYRACLLADGAALKVGTRIEEPHTVQNILTCGSWLPQLGQNLG